MTTTPGRMFKGQTADERRAERRERLIEAARDVIGDDGWPAATMTAVIARAGLTERYFYESFRSREELHVAVLARVASELRDEVLAIVDADYPTPQARVLAGARALVAVLVGDPRNGRAFLLDGQADLRVHALRREVLGDFERLLTDQRTAFLGDGPSSPREPLAAVAIVGALHELVSRYLEGGLELSEDELALYIADTALAIPS